MNLVLIYGMQRHFWTTMIFLMIDLILRCVFLMRCYYKSSKYRDDWQDMIARVFVHGFSGRGRDGKGTYKCDGAYRSHHVYSHENGDIKAKIYHDEASGWLLKIRLPVRDEDVIFHPPQHKDKDTEDPPHGEWSTECDMSHCQVQAAVSVKATDVYLDFSVPIMKKCFVVFVGQILLTILYVASLRDDLFGLLCENDVNWQLLFLSCCVQLLLVSQMGKGFRDNLLDWAKCMHAGAFEGMSEIFTDEACEQCIDRPTVRVRFLLACFVNGILYDFLIRTVYLSLIGNDDGMDYVKDCLALGFITTLDDIDKDDLFWIRKSKIRSSLSQVTQTLGVRMSSMSHDHSLVQSFLEEGEEGRRRDTWD